MAYQIVLTAAASKALKGIRNRATIEQIAEVIDSLADAPMQAGKPLRGLLSGYRSIRAARQRHRIIYRVHEDHIEVLDVMIGRRKSQDRDGIYQLLQRKIRTGNPPDGE